MKTDDQVNGSTDEMDIPEALKVGNRQPLTAEEQAKLDAATAKAPAPKPPADIELAKAQAEAKTEKSRIRIERLKAKLSGETTKMPASAKDAVAIIQQKGKTVKTPGPKEQQLRALKGNSQVTTKPKEPAMKTAAKKTKSAKAAAASKPSTARRKTDHRPATAKAAKPASGVAKGKTAPSGMVVEILKLASRGKGVTPTELNDLTKWKGAPWKWLFSNPKKNGYCDRWGYTFESFKDDDGTHYKVTKNAA